MVQGAILAAVGIAIIFIGLTILMLFIMGLSKAFPSARQEPSRVEPATESAARTEKEVVAAIALALAQLTEEQARPRAKAPARAVSSWQAYGRTEQMGSRERVRQRR